MVAEKLCVMTNWFLRYLFSLIEHHFECRVFVGHRTIININCFQIFENKNDYLYDKIENGNG